MDPATARSLSLFRNSRPPPRSAPYLRFSSAFIAGISVRGDSMMPFVSAVSGKISISSGANFDRRFDASAISSGPNARLSFASAKGTFLGLTQQTSFASARSATTGSSSMSFCRSISVLLNVS